MKIGGPVVPLDCSFIKRDNLRIDPGVAQGVAPVVYESTSSNLAFDFRGNISTLSKCIGYANLTDSREISPKLSRDNDKRKWHGKFRCYFSHGVCPFTQHVLHISRYSNLRYQNIEKARHTDLVD